MTVQPVSRPTAGQRKILIASFLEPEQGARIRAAGGARTQTIYEPELLPSPRYAADHSGVPRNLDEDAMARWRRHLADADILFDFDWLEPERLPINAPRVQWVQATSSGIGEFVARTGLDRWPAIITTAGGVHSQPLAEFVALALLYVAKDVPDLRQRQATRRWERYTARQLAGQRMLLVGLGHVGRQIAATCAALGVEVWGMRREPGAGLPDGVSRLVAREELDAVLPMVDALVLACPYTRETHHLIGARQFSALRRGATVVNVARGAVIAEPELIAALVDGRVGGAVLDVFEEEPLPPDSRLWDLPNVLVSPHSASTVAEENARIVDIFLDNLDGFLGGRPMRNVFDRDRGY